MGGKGSGRKPNIRKLLEVERRNKIGQTGSGEILILPNYSGLREGARKDSSTQFLQTGDNISELVNDAGYITEGSGATELSELSDVGDSTPTNKNVLVADGDSWESRALVEADISDLQSYILASGVTFENLNANSDVGTGAAQVSAGNHTHTGVYEPAGVAAADITDSTADGRALLTSADANPFTDADESKLDAIEASADVTDAANVSSSGGLIYIDHGATAGTSRPSVSGYVIWIGSVEPTNATNGDLWVDTS